MKWMTDQLAQLGFEDKMAAVCADVIAVFGILAFAGLIYIIRRNGVRRNGVRLELIHPSVGHRDPTLP